MAVAAREVGLCIALGCMSVVPIPILSHLCSSHPLNRLQYCAIHKAAFEEQPEASTSTECSGPDSYVCSKNCIRCTSAMQAVLVASVVVH